MALKNIKIHLTFEERREYARIRRLAFPEKYPKQNYQSTEYRMYGELRRLAFPERYQQIARQYHLKRTYNMTAEEYLRRLAEQGGVCSICSAMVPLQVDHNHTSGQVRKLLCRRCNTVLGFVKESPELLLRLAQYLREHSK